MIIVSGVRFVWQALNRFWSHNGPDRAAAVAYYTLLSLLPLLIFGASVATKVVGSPDEAYRATLTFFQGLVLHMDPQTQEALKKFISRSVVLGWPGLLLLAWTARRAFIALLSALETVFEVPPRGIKGVARGNLLALALVILAGVGLLASMAIAMVMATAEGVLRTIAGRAGAQVFMGLSAFLLTRILPVFFGLAFFFVLYRVVAPRTPHRVGCAFIGASLATILWEGSKAVFTYYVRYLAHYVGMFGALEGVIVLALWLEISVSIVLFAGEIASMLLSVAASQHAAKEGVAARRAERAKKKRKRTS